MEAQGHSPADLRFVMDFSLFRIAKQLRLLGFDVLCNRTLQSSDLLRIAKKELRVLVTGSTRLLPQLHPKKRRERAKPRRPIRYNSDGESEYSSSSSDTDNPVPYVFVKSTEPSQVSLTQVIQQLGVRWDQRYVFTRCVECNVLIGEVPRDRVQQLVHKTVFETYTTFYQCPQCCKVFWGMDNGIVVNFKALRTIEILKKCCVNGDAAVAKQHILAMPRLVKCVILSYLKPEDLCTLSVAVPSLQSLCRALSNGEDLTYVPEDHEDSRRRRQLQLQSRDGHVPAE